MRKYRAEERNRVATFRCRDPIGSWTAMFTRVIAVGDQSVGHYNW